VNEDLKVQSADSADKAKLVVAVLLVLGGIVAFNVLDAMPAWQRWLIVVASWALAAGALAWSAYGRSLWRFMLDSRVELHKIVRPTLNDTLKLTAIVFAFVSIGGVFFWLVDLFLAWATKLLTGQA
jgi:preprotein translocase subunit SecE